MKVFGSIAVRASKVRTSAMSFAVRKLSSAAPAIVDVVGGRNIEGLDITPRCAQVLQNSLDNARLYFFVCVHLVNARQSTNFLLRFLAA